MSNNYGDMIKLLPIDKSVPLQHELTIMNSLFKDQSTTGTKSYNYTLLLIIFCVFYIMSLPQLNTLISKYIPSQYLLILFKSILFIIIFILLTVFIK